MILWLAAVAISAAPNRRSSIATNTLGSLTLPSSSAIERATYLIGRQLCPGHPPAQHVYNFSSSAEQAATRQLMLTANTSVAQALFTAHGQASGLSMRRQVHVVRPGQGGWYRD